MHTYVKGEYFGELSLLYDNPRALSIAAARKSIFLTISKKDYNHYLKRFEKKQKEQIVEFFKNVNFLKGLSNQSIVKMEYSFNLLKFNKAGQYVLREGDPVTHIALVKDGEFDVVKKNLKGLDHRILDFLHKGEVRKKIQKQVLLLPGRTSIY